MTDRDVAMVWFGCMAGILLMAWLGRGRGRPLTYADGFNNGSKMAARSAEWDQERAVAEQQFIEKIVKAVKAP